MNNMESLKSYIEYEENVIDLLKSRIESEQENGYCVKVQYPYNYGDKKYRFDLVVLDNSSKIIQVFEVKGRNALRLNFNTIMAQLQEYKRVTGAAVYLAYLNEDNQLEILPFDRQAKKSTYIIPETTTIKTFSEFYNALKEICDYDDSELQFFFRGHSNYKYKPIPGIFRDNSIKNENQIFHEAIRKSPSVFTEDMSTFDKLVKMQHYELPTRLLDITTNPLVALFFACFGNENTDGAVMVFPMSNDKIKYFDSDAVCILSNLAKCSVDFSFTKDKSYLVYDIQQDKPNFKGKYLDLQAVKDVFCVMPKLNNERIIRQQGAFFIFGMGKTKDKPANFKDKPLIIKIKAECKKDILKELQVLGINEAALFPETDKIMRQIKIEMNR